MFHNYGCRESGFYWKCCHWSISRLSSEYGGGVDLRVVRDSWITKSSVGCEMHSWTVKGQETKWRMLTCRQIQGYGVSVHNELVMQSLNKTRNCPWVHWGGRLIHLWNGTGIQMDPPHCFYNSQQAELWVYAASVWGARGRTSTLTVVRTPQVSTGYTARKWAESFTQPKSSGTASWDEFNMPWNLKKVEDLDQGAWGKVCSGNVMSRPSV